jgi:hypothetical protein
MSNEKRVITPEIERELLACLPFEEGETVEVTLSNFTSLPEKVRPYFRLGALSFDQRRRATREMMTEEGLSLKTMTEILQEGVLSDWRNWRTRSRPEIAFSKEEIGKLTHGYVAALFWMAFGFNNPSALEREGLG